MELTTGKPQGYDPHFYHDAIDLDATVECSHIDCKCTQLKVKEGFVFWTWKDEDTRTCFVFCSLEHLFDAVTPTCAYTH